MRTVEHLNKTYVLPFGPDEGPPPYLEYILVQPDGVIRIIGLCGMGMAPIFAQMVAQALLHAVEVAKKGKST